MFTDFNPSRWAADLKAGDDVWLCKEGCIGTVWRPFYYEKGRVREEQDGDGEIPKEEAEARTRALIACGSCGRIGVGKKGGPQDTWFMRPDGTGVNYSFLLAPLVGGNWVDMVAKGSLVWLCKERAEAKVARQFYFDDEEFQRKRYGVPPDATYLEYKTKLLAAGQAGSLEMSGQPLPWYVKADGTGFDGSRLLAMLPTRTLIRTGDDLRHLRDCIWTNGEMKVVVEILVEDRSALTFGDLISLYGR